MSFGQCNDTTEKKMIISINLKKNKKCAETQAIQNQKIQNLKALLKYIKYKNISGVLDMISHLKRGSNFFLLLHGLVDFC